MDYPVSHPLSLHELNSLVSNAIHTAMADSYWVEAELTELHEVSGHCYMELVQKAEHGSVPIARASAKCWRQAWGVLKPFFVRTTGGMPQPGMHLLMEVYPQFHEAYGFSWIVTDIDPTYTMGDMARKRKEIIEHLKAQGIFTLNKELSLPALTTRIAVISSDHAAGYGDFYHQLLHNKYHFRFQLTLFPAIMQGDRVEQSIISALNEINARIDEFDCVVIIRGGGATSDLSGFDTLPLAENIANFPLPVITGIGHERDECVLDMISHTRVKTPTAAAALLIERLVDALTFINNIETSITRLVSQRLDFEKMRLQRLSTLIPQLFSLMKTRQDSRIEQLQLRLHGAIRERLSTQRHRLDLLEQRALSLDPTLPLKRGYSITFHQGKVVRDVSQLAPGSIIETRVAKGTVTSEVKTIK